MNNIYGKNMFENAQLDQSDLLANTSSRWGAPQMNGQTSWNTAGAASALYGVNSRRNIPFQHPSNCSMNAGTYNAPPPPAVAANMVQSIPQPQVGMAQDFGISRRNFPSPGTMPDVTHEQASFKQDPLNNKWIKEVTNSKGKVKIQDLTSGFMIPFFSKVTTEKNNLKTVIIEYIAQGKSYSSIMSADDYINERYHRYFPEIVRFPNCTKAQFNELIGFLMKQARTQEIVLYSRHGWHEFANGDFVYAYEPKETYIPHELLSKGVKLNKLLPLINHPCVIISNWKNLVQRDDRLAFCGLYRCSSKLKFFISGAGVHNGKIPVLSPSADCTEEALTAFSATRDITEVPLTNLVDGEKAVTAEHGYNCDGVSLFVDYSFADEEKKVIDALKAIIRASEKDGRSLPAVISQNAALTAMKLAPNVFLPINTTGITVEKTPEELQIIFAEMDTLIVTTAQNHANEVKRLFAEKAPVFREALSKDAQGEALETLVMFCLTGLFFTRFLGLNFVNSEMINKLIPIIMSHPHTIMSADEAIVRELVAVLSELIRAKKYTVIRKKNNMKFTDDGHTLIIDGNRLYLSSAVLEDIVVYMQKTHSIEAVIKALKRLGYLACTDFDTHPIELYDANGQHQRLYMYDVLADILDSDIVYQLFNPDIAAFLHTADELPHSGFMPLIIAGNGNIAGRMFDLQVAENESVAIYGQSGYGKTYTSNQITASRYIQGYDIIMFDTGFSDKYEALCDNLSKEFVDKNVVFHDLDSAELNVDIFHIDRTASLPSQKKALLGIITAGVGELSVPQTNLLRTTISDLLEVTDKNEPINPDDLLELLNEEGATYESLRNRLEPFLENIKDYKLTNGTWKDLFSGERKIHVIQVSEGFSGNGNQVVDALLAGLFNFKLDNPQRPLSVVIDEVQNHNMSASSPLRRIFKEGRKHRLSVIASTQDFYARSTEIGSALGKADMQIFHRPTQDSANLVAAELRWKKADLARFDTMERGDVILKGSLYNKELKRNTQATLSGHIADFIPNSNENDSGCDNHLNNPPPESAATNILPQNE